MLLRHSIDGVTYHFDGLNDLLAKATTARSGDELAGLAAANAIERFFVSRFTDPSKQLRSALRR